MPSSKKTSIAISVQEKLKQKEEELRWLNSNEEFRSQNNTMGERFNNQTPIQMGPTSNLGVDGNSAHADVVSGDLLGHSTRSIQQIVELMGGDQIEQAEVSKQTTDPHSSFTLNPRANDERPRQIPNQSIHSAKALGLVSKPS